MAPTNVSRNTDKAESCRVRGELDEAGDHYASSGYSYLGRGPPGKFGMKVSHGEYMMLKSAACYRIASLDTRCENRCKQGILIAKDTIDRVFSEKEPDNCYDRARRGVWHEYIGGFRVIGNLSGTAEAYDNAIEVYTDAGDPDTGSSEQEHMWCMRFYRSLLEAVEANGVTGGDDERGDIDSFQNDLSLSDRVEEKRDRLPKLVSQLSDRGGWA